jgi:hypothetical protein
MLDQILGDLRLGYLVICDWKNEQDGWLKVRPSHEHGLLEGMRRFDVLDVAIRVQGRDYLTWKGRLSFLPESEAKEFPLPLSSRAGSSVAVMAGGNPNALVPQTQHYLVYIDLNDSDAAVAPDTLAQVKIRCKPETYARWLWRKINDLFDLGLI